MNHFTLLTISKVLVCNRSLRDDHFVVLNGDLASVSPMGQLAYSLSMFSLNSHGRFLVQIISRQIIFIAHIAICIANFSLLLRYQDTSNWLKLI